MMYQSLAWLLRNENIIYISLLLYSLCLTVDSNGNTPSSSVRVNLVFEYTAMWYPYVPVMCSFSVCLLEIGKERERERESIN